MGPDLFLAQALPKTGSLSIGRADNADIRITDPLASRLHARSHVTAGMFEIEDIGSINRRRSATSRWSTASGSPCFRAKR
jgi:pSer/pThr/pTyr-binding forkhead associated (FHA) protein